MTGPLNDLAYQANRTSAQKGFWDYGLTGDEDRDSAIISTKLALIHSEVSEALETLREDGSAYVSEVFFETPFDHESKPVGFASEIADVLIRVFDLAGELGIDLDRLVALKMTYNESRPAKHGKNF